MSLLTEQCLSNKNPMTPKRGAKNIHFHAITIENSLPSIRSRDKNLSGLKCLLVHFSHFMNEGFLLGISYSGFHK